MFESMDSQAGAPNKEKGYAEKGAKEPTKAAQAAISQSAAYALQGGQSSQAVNIIDDQEIVRTQIVFFKNNCAGCAFAAYAARDPEKYGWFHKVLPVDYHVIDEAIKQAIEDSQVTTLSLVFPDVKSLSNLLDLIRIFQESTYIFIEENTLFEDFRCLGFRVKVDNLKSWVSGFGNFDFFPPTRRTAYTEIIFRVKPRPNYTMVMKESPKDVIHLADMNMLGIADEIFKRMWKASLTRTAQLIGHKPDLKSAAKTTFILPKEAYFLV